jgi:hypothetical protein
VPFQQSPWHLYVASEVGGTPTYTLPDKTVIGSLPVTVKVLVGATRVLVVPGNRGMLIDGADSWLVSAGTAVVFQVHNDQWIVISSS